MLTIIAGGAMSHKDEILRDGIIAAARKEKKILVMIPDQFSFEYDKLLYEIFGAKLFNSITVTGMNRLAEEIRKQQGSALGASADNNVKSILMFQAVKAAKSGGKIRFLQRNLDKPSFVSEMLLAVTEFRRNEITPEILEKAASDTSGTLSEKLHDLSVVFDCYNKLLEEHGLSDGLSSVSETADTAMKTGLFKDYEIFIDRYDTFSADEYRLIETMLHQCDNMSVALTLSDENNSRSNMSPFAAVLQTKSNLERIASSVGIETQLVRSHNYYYNKAALVHINANIFSLGSHPSENAEGVKVVFAQDCYDEVDYCAAEIKRIVREEGLKYSDIAVISRQLSDYAPMIESAFERYEIPAFIDMKHSVSNSALAIYLSSVLDCLKGKTFRTERILRMIKSPLSAFKDFEIAAIEEYCYCWDVDGEMWRTPFTAGDPVHDDLDRLNSIREKITEPVESFRKTISSESRAGDIIKAFTLVLDKYGLTERANSIAKQSLEIEGERSCVTEMSDSLELAREFKQMWLLFLESLDSIYDSIGDRKISFREFSDLFELLLSGMTVSSPPQRINTVTVASAEHSRLSAVKAVFVLGANADKLPAAPQKGGLFSEREKKQLTEHGVPFSETALTGIYRERLIAYLALTQGSDKLYVCCPKTNADGKGLNPSPIVKELIKMFGQKITVDASSLGAGFYCCTPKSAFAKFSECMNDHTVESETLKKALISVPRYKDKVNSLIKNSKTEVFSLSEKNAAELFFKDKGGKKTISISPSSVEKYNRCPFEYFCNYGLNLKVPMKNGMNSVNRGNIIHYVLENIMSEEKDGKKFYREDFETLTDSEITQLVDKYALEYIEREMGGDFGKTMRFFAIFERIRENAVSVVKNIREELSRSEFKPCAFEYVIEQENGRPYLTVENSDMVINVRGKIDRVDVFADKDGKKYFKIVDYKTGVVKNLMKKVLHGAGLQLIIYLAALLEEENRISPDSAFAGGMIYTPAVYINSSTSVSEDKDIPEGDVDKALEVTARFSEDYVKKKLERYGIVCGDENILKALNQDLSKQFIPSGKNGAVMEGEKLNAVQQHAVSMLEKAGTGLLHGKIPAEPLSDATGTYIKKPCSYCSYSPVCGVKNAPPKNLIAAGDEEKLDRLLDGLVEMKNNRR